MSSEDALIGAYTGNLIDEDGFNRGVGIAPSAQIIVAKNTVPASDDNSTVQMTHLDFENITKALAMQGARFANNSWNLRSEYGGYSQYDYTLFSKFADQLVRDGDGIWGNDSNREMTLVFLQVIGLDNPLPQVIPDPIYVTSPANAKNVITVGATRGWADEDDEDTYIKLLLKPLMWIT